MPSDGDYDVMLALVETIRDEMRLGLAEIKQALKDQEIGRDQNCKSHTDRLTALEAWRTTVGGAYAAVATLSAIVGSVVSLVVAWFTQGRK